MGTDSVSEFISPKQRVGLLAFLAIIALVLRCLYLPQAIRYDEAYTCLMYAAQPFTVALSDYSFPNNHLFHTLLVRVVMLLWGNAEWIVRLPAFLAGLLLLPVTFEVIRRQYDTVIALVTLALMAASPMLIEYTVNARGYTMVALCFWLLLWLVQPSCRCRFPTTFWWGLFVFINVIGFYTIPVMLYPLAVVVAWLLLVRRCEEPADSDVLFAPAFVRQLLLALAAIFLLVSLLYLPVIGHSGLAALVANDAVRPRSWDFVASGFSPWLFRVWLQWHWGHPAWLWLGGIGVGIGLLAHRRIVSVAGNPLVHGIWPVLAGILPLLLLHRVLPFERVWLFLLPLYLAWVASGWVFLCRWITGWLFPQREVPVVLRRLPGVLIILLVLVLSGVTLRSYRFNDDMARMSETLGYTLSSADVLLTPGALVKPLEYYCVRYHRACLVVDDYWNLSALRQSSPTIPAAAEAQVFLLVPADLPLTPQSWVTAELARYHLPNLPFQPVTRHGELVLYRQSNKQSYWQNLPTRGESG